MRSTLLLLIGFTLANLGAAQPVSFSGPVEAFAFDLPTRSLRSVIGVPGSSSFGSAIVERVDFGSVAPGQKYAIALQGAAWHIASHLDSARPSLQALTGITARPQGITWSSDGSLAILFSFAGNWLQIVSGLPSQPSVGQRIEVSSQGGVLSAVASDAAGKQIAVAITGRNAGVYLLQAATHAFVPLVELSNPIALTFSSDSADLLVIDSATRQLSVINVASRSSQEVSLEGLAHPFAVRAAPATASSKVIYVASRGDQILREYDLLTQHTIADVSLNFTPTGLEEFGRNSFLVASRARAIDPLWLFVDQPGPAVYFVPALPVPHRPEREERAR